MSKYPVTIDTAQRALQYLDASDTDVWVKSGMALKSEYGDAGFSLWDEWSAGAANYDAAACKSRWKSFKAGGRVGIGSLIHAAKQAGFDPKAQAVNAPYEQLTPEARAQREAERKAQAEREAAAIERGHRQAQTQAQKIWGNAIAHAPHLYLGRKLVKAHGVRFEAVGAAFNLLVPLRDADGTLWNLQRIQPDGTKLFLKNGRKSGLWHLIHAPMDSTTEGGSEPVAGVLLVAEGYATAASLHEATGYPVAVAFDAGNLVPVCLALRLRYPDARILICADNDSQTHAKTGHNTGVESAHKAAGLVGAMVCIPDGLEATESDFNDLAVRMGVDVVRAQIEACLTAFVPVSTPSPSSNDVYSESSQTEPVHDAEAIPIEAYTDAVAESQESASSTPKINTKANTKPNTKDKPTQAVANAGRGSNGRFMGGSHFTCDDNGVWYHGLDSKGEAKKPQLICTPLRVTANTRDEGENDWGYLLEFSDPLGTAKAWAMPSRMLAGDGAGYRERLLSMGLRIEAGHEVRNLLTRYIQSCYVDTYARCTERVGWFDGAFVLPDRTIGESGAERILFQSDVGGKSPFTQSGTLADWQTHIATPCAGNSRVVFAIACAFAGILLQPTGIQSGGFHFVGDSSIGKSTMLYVASSVFGSHKFMRTWNNTSTALESTAAQYSDTLLVLDEIGQVSDPRTIGEVVYMLGNEVGKGRGLRAGAGTRPMLEWRLMYLSSGEKSLYDIMHEVGKSIKAGQETRLVNIRANVNEDGDGQGSIFERYSGAEGAGMSDRLKQATRQYYGTAGITFIGWLQPQLDTIRDSIRAEVDRLAKEWTPTGAHGQVARVVNRFALVAVAGELATRAGVTGWKQGEAEIAAFMCLEDWLNERGGVGNSEEAKALAQVRAWMEANQQARFAWWERVTDNHAPRVANMAGFIRCVDEYGNPAKTHILENGEWVDNRDGCFYHWYVLPEVFKNEICKGFNHKTVARLLLERGIIEGSGKDGKEPTVSKRLPATDRTQRCYLFKTSVIE